jgi:SulP family sulfate permease
VLAYRLDGPLFFAVADRFLREITATSSVRVVILRLGSVVMLDATGAHVLGQIVEDLHRRGITVLVKVASAEHRRLLAAVGALAPLVERGHVFDTFPEAAAHAARHVAAHTPAAGVATHWPHGPQAALPDHQVIQVTPTADLSPTVPNERITSDRR